MRETRCIDCGHPLHWAAGHCPLCGSSDPFGRARSDSRAARIFLIALAVMLLAMMLGYALGMITPQMLRGFLRWLS